MLLDLWAWRVNSTTPPAGGRGGGTIKRLGEVRGITDPSLRDAVLRSRIRQEDEDLMVLVATFVRTLQ